MTSLSKISSPRGICLFTQLLPFQFGNLKQIALQPRGTRGCPVLAALAQLLEEAGEELWHPPGVFPGAAGRCRRARSGGRP